MKRTRNIVATFGLNINGANGLAELIGGRTGVLPFVSGSDARDLQRHQAGGWLVFHTVLVTLCYYPKKEIIPVLALLLARW